MSETTYDLLINKVKQLKNQILSKNIDLTTIKNDPQYFYYKSRMDRVNNTGNQWIDSEGQQWEGPDAHAGYVEALAYITTHNEQLKSLENELIGLNAQLTDAVAQVTEYEKNSPTLKNELDLKKSAVEAGIKIKQIAEENKKVIIVTISFFVFVVAIALTLKSYNKQKPTT